MSEPSAAFKDRFDTALLEALLGRFEGAAGPSFSAATARAAAAPLGGPGFDTMSSRVCLIADALKAGFGATPTAGVMAALVAALPPLKPDTEGFGFSLWPHGELIARHGLDDVDASFGAMVELTQRFTSEFAVRPFLAADADGILTRLEALVDHPNVHVRRWVSEGTRTRLPWGRRVPALAALQERRLTLLARLRHDPEPYVRRSVANHLGDIFKDDPDAALTTLRAWLSEGHPHVNWICRHAARTPLKAGHPEVLALFGHAASGVTAQAFTATPAEVPVGATVTLRAALEHPGAAPSTPRVDYALTRPSRGRAAPSRKVFRWADPALASGEVAHLETRYAFVPRSIRPVHPGAHTFELIIDGQVAATATVTVV